MELNLKCLSDKIEYAREILSGLVSNKSLTDNEVVKCSQQLDNLLTEFEYIKAFCIPKDAA